MYVYNLQLLPGTLYSFKNRVYLRFKELSFMKDHFFALKTYIVPSLSTTHRILSPFFNFKSSTTSAGTVVRRLEPLRVNPVSLMHMTSSNSSFIKNTFLG